MAIKGLQTPTKEYRGHQRYYETLENGYFQILLFSMLLFLLPSPTSLE
jgi:hypothetical protein